MRRKTDPHLVIVSPPMVSFDTSTWPTSIPAEPCIAPIGTTRLVIRHWNWFERLRRKLLGHY